MGSYCGDFQGKDPSPCYLLGFYLIHDLCLTVQLHSVLDEMMGVHAFLSYSLTGFIEFQSQY